MTTKIKNQSKNEQKAKSKQRKNQTREKLNRQYLTYSLIAMEE